MASTVSPNRMTLLALKRRYTISKRGLKLLKDKLEAFDRERRYIEELMEAFVELLNQYESETSPELSTRMVFNIKVPFLDVSLKRMDIPDLYLQTGPAFYKALSVYEELLPHLLKLASLRNALHMMSVKTRRRSNALEYNVVPELERTIKWVQQYLDEMERSQTVRIMKVKSMLEKERGNA